VHVRPSVATIAIVDAFLIGATVATRILRPHPPEVIPAQWPGRRTTPSARPRPATTPGFRYAEDMNHETDMDGDW